MQPSVHQLYKRLETIGKGAYGSVHRGIHIPTGKVVALKIINLDTEDDDVGDIQREVALLTQLRDAPNVTQYYGCYLDGPRVWIVMEYAEGGSVRTLMKACKDNVIEEKYAVIIIREVLQGLKFLHKSAIIHRDLKAANILITAAGKVMICDFGVSALLVTASSKRNTLIGTPHWMAPEVAQSAAYDTKADIWSLGIVIYEMIKGNVPHAQIFDQVKLIQMIPRIKPPRLTEGEGSKELREFLSLCLRESPKDRFSADELLKSKLMKSVAKTPVSILSDLITRYEAWVQEGNTRASMVGSLPWEEEENQQPTKVQRESVGWEFETVRGRVATDSTSQVENHFSSDLMLKSDSASYPTARPSTSKVPLTLRMLFEDESTDNSPFPIGRPVDLPFPSRSGTPLRRRGRSNSNEDNDGLATVRQAPEFVFPPRNQNLEDPPPADINEHITGGSEYSSSQDIQPPLASDISHGVNQPDSEDASAPSDVNQPRSPPLPDSDVIAAQKTLTDPPFSQGRQDTSLGYPILHRKRSKSSASESVSRTIVRTHRDRNLASSVDFHFPSRSSSGLDSDPLSNAGPPTSTSASSHHPASSLDTSFLPKRLPSPGSLPRPSAITRKGSAPALNSNILQGQGSPSLEPGSSLRHGLPGLKDVLKIPAVTSEHQLVMSDLLPPSPFLQHSQQPSPSATNYPVDQSSRPWLLNTSASSSTTSLNSIASLQNQYGGDAMSSMPSHFRSRSQGLISSLGVTSNSLSGPTIKPLDFGPLTQSHDKTHAYLASTVDDLARWLSVVETGLTRVLDKTVKDSIAEEQEPDDQQLVSERDASIQEEPTSSQTRRDSIDIVS